MFTANNRNYCISIKLLWGSSDTAADSANSLKNVITLDEDRIGSFTLTSSLLKPCISGSFTYTDMKKTSRLSGLTDIPIVYGNISFFQSKGAGSQYSVGDLEPFEQESFSEVVIIDSFEVVGSTADTTTFSFKFTMADMVAFEVGLSPYSTFTDEENAKDFREVVKALFAASGVKAAFDYDTITVNAKVPFITSPNCSFNDAIEYVYRKVFDYDFSNTNGKDYCKVVYNNGERKYEMWRFGDVGKAGMFKCKSKDVHYVELRENIAVAVGGESAKTGCTAEFFSNGDAKDLHWVFGDKTFTDYDYLTNNFADTVDGNVDSVFLDHSDILYAKQKSKSSVIKRNSSLLSNLQFGSHYSTFRDNGSLYDVFNAVLFSSPYTRVRTPGCIGRYVGNCISLKFVNAETSPFRYSSGVYLITGMSHIVTHSGKDWDFVTVMDTYKPYLLADSERKEAI